MIYTGLGCIFISGIFATKQSEMSSGYAHAAKVETHMLIIDYRAQRHWIIKESQFTGFTYQKGKFTDQHQNINRVPSDAWIITIKEPMKLFLQEYKQRYNIPQEQEALN